MQIPNTKEVFTEDRSSSDHQKPSEEFLKAIFGDSDESSTDTEDEEVQDSQKTVMIASTPSEDFRGNRTEDNKESVISVKMLTVMDMDLSDRYDNKEFGPVPPPPTSSLMVNLRADIINSKKKGKFYFMNADRICSLI